jgi:hypothetical protein
LKCKIVLVLITTLLFISSLTVFVLAQTDSTIWHDGMSYSSVAKMQEAGWTSEHIDGVRVGSGGVIIDGSVADTAIHYNGHLASGIYNWKVESRGRWIGGNHSAPDVSVNTQLHSYLFQADGWYSQFTFYHDGNKVWTSPKGTYTESKNTYETITLVKSNNQVNCYFNGQLEYTYTEEDTTASQLTGVAAVTPWRGATEYNYFSVSTAPSSDTPQSGNILSNPIVIGGVVTGVGVGVGAVVYYFVIAGGSSEAGSAGTGSAAAGSAGASSGGGDGSGSGSGGGSSGGSGNTGGGTLIHNHPPNPAGELAMGDIFNMSDISAQMQMQTQNQQQAQTIQTQMQTDNQQSQAERLKIQQDLQTQNFQIQQDVTVNKAKTQDKMFQNADNFIRAQNDPDAVADSGEGGGGGEA